MYSIKTPCAHCPFRSDVKPFLHPERVTEIYQGIPCHQTTQVEDDEDNNPILDGSEKTCAGFLIIREKNDDPSQLMKIAERLGQYNAGELDMEALIYSNLDEMQKAYEAIWEKPSEML